MKICFLCVFAILISGCLLREDPVSPNDDPRASASTDTSAVPSLPLKSAGEASLAIVVSARSNDVYTLGPAGFELVAINPDALTREVLYRSSTPMTSLRSVDNGRLLVADIAPIDTGRPLLVFDVQERRTTTIWLPRGTDSWVASPTAPAIVCGVRGEIRYVDILAASNYHLASGIPEEFSPDGNTLALSRTGLDTPDSRTLLELSTGRILRVSHPDLPHMSALQWTDRGLFAVHSGSFPAVGTGVHVLQVDGEGPAETIFRWPMYIPVTTPECRISDDGSLVAFVAPIPFNNGNRNYSGSRYSLTILSMDDRRIISSEALDTVPTDFRFTNDLRYIFFRQGMLLIRKHLRP